MSALTQKKGALTAAEAATIRAHGSAWGCDLCQEACPHTGHADFSPLPAFLADRIPYLTAAQIEAMHDDAFPRRAYAWRGRAGILRNLRLLKEKTHVPQ